LTSAILTAPAELLARELLERFPGEAAAELDLTPTDEVVACLTAIAPAGGAALLGALTPVTAQRVLEQLEPAQAAPVLKALDPARAAALVGRLDPDLRTALLAGLEQKRAAEIAELAAYPPDTAGALMDRQVMAFRPTMRVGEVLDKLRHLPQKKAVELFLVDPEGRVAGAVPLQELVVADLDEPLSELTGPAPIAIDAMAARDDVVDALTSEKMAGVVVVDAEGRLLGVIRRDALIQAAREEASADAQAMVGASKEERALSPAWFAVRKRLPWLVVNLGTAFLAAAVVGLFEANFAKVTALAVLLPVVAGQSGNTGAQALAVTMRGLALREVRAKHALPVALKELQAAVLNGIGIAAVTAVAVYFWSGSTGLTLVIGLSMVLSMAAAGLAGAVIPMALTALRQDPAQSSSIVLTTVTDVAGFFSFLGIATLLSSML